MNLGDTSEYTYVYRGAKHSSAIHQPGKYTLFYVGENEASLEPVSECLQARVLSAVSYAQAATYLRQLGKKGMKIDALLIDVPFEQDSLTKFRQQMLSSEYGSIPVFYLTSQLTAADYSTISRLHGVDDIFNPVLDIFTMADRINFLQVTRRNIQTGVADLSRQTSVRDFHSPFHYLKRCTDIILAFSLAIAAIPLMLIIALLIKLDSRGPVLHCTFGAGLGYRIFKIYNFRIMKVGPERMVSSLSATKSGRFAGTCFTTDLDPRLTTIGSMLKRTGLYRLPELYNVLKLDISLFGNRPVPLIHATQLIDNNAAQVFELPAGMFRPWKSGDKF